MLPDNMKGASVLTTVVYPKMAKKDTQRLASQRKTAEKFQLYRIFLVTYVQKYILFETISLTGLTHNHQFCHITILCLLTPLRRPEKFKPSMDRLNVPS